jgi:hypothetical protein
MGEFVTGTVCARPRRDQLTILSEGIEQPSGAEWTDTSFCLRRESAARPPGPRGAEPSRQPGSKLQHAPCAWRLLSWTGTQSTPTASVGLLTRRRSHDHAAPVPILTPYELSEKILCRYPTEGFSPDSSTSIVCPAGSDVSAGMSAIDRYFRGLCSVTEQSTSQRIATKPPLIPSFVVFHPPCPQVSQSFHQT